MLIIGAICCFPITIPLALVCIHHLYNSRFVNSGSLQARLQAEWEAGQLEHLFLSNISGAKLVWGFTCGRFIKSVRWFIALFIGLGLFVGPFVVLITILENSYISTFEIVMTAEVIVLIILILIIQGGSLLFLSTLVSSSRSLDRIGAPLEERMRKGFVAILFDTLVCAGLTMPGALATFLLWLGTDLLDFHPMRREIMSFLRQYEEVVVVLFPIIAFGVYLSVNLLVCWLAARKIFGTCMLRADQDFALAVRRLGERREEAAGSKIFGE